MEKEMRKWETPKLICLYRGRPEEVLVRYCKVTVEGGPSNLCDYGGTTCVEKATS